MSVIKLIVILATVVILIIVLVGGVYCHSGECCNADCHSEGCYADCHSEGCYYTDFHSGERCYAVASIINIQLEMPKVTIISDTCTIKIINARSVNKTLKGLIEGQILDTSAGKLQS